MQDFCFLSASLLLFLAFSPSLVLPSLFSGRAYEVHVASSFLVQTPRFGFGVLRHRFSVGGLQRGRQRLRESAALARGTAFARGVDGRAAGRHPVAAQKQLVGGLSVVLCLPSFFWFVC